MRLITAVVATLALSFPMMGEISVKDYQEDISSPNQVKALSMRSYMGGLARGIFGTNVWFVRFGSGHPMYCAPDKLPLNEDNYLRILDDEIKIVVSLGESQAEVDALPVVTVLIRGLRNTFPCPNK